MGKTHKANDKIHAAQKEETKATVAAKTPTGDVIIPEFPKDLRTTIDHKTHKFNEKIHHEELKAGHSVTPRTWGKNLDHSEPPRQAKKNGGGKGNWGREGDEIEDTEFANPIRKLRSNSRGHMEEDVFRTKFEENEEPIDESVVGEEGIRYFGAGDKVANANV